MKARQPLRHLWAAGACALALVAGAAQASERYRVVAVFDTVFGKDGRIERLQPHEEAEHPPALWQGLRARVENLRVPAPLDAQGQPATLNTGLYVELEVQTDAQGGQLRIVGMDVQPLVLKRGHAAYPEELLRSAGWVGAVDAECQVGSDGRCGEVKTQALPGMPPSLLRWAGETLALWQFQPPRLNGVPVVARFKQSFNLATPDGLPLNFLRRGSGSAPFRW